MDHVCPFFLCVSANSFVPFPAATFSFGSFPPPVSSASSWFFSTSRSFIFFVFISSLARFLDPLDPFSHPCHSASPVPVTVPLLSNDLFVIFFIMILLLYLYSFYIVFLCCGDCIFSLFFSSFLVFQNVLCF